jgi:L-ribulose-5-phosphate 3-epimerase UlaE
MRGIHTKDGLWPTNPKDLGEEVRLGKRKVDFARIMARLKDLDHRVKFTIER